MPPLQNNTDDAKISNILLTLVKKANLDQLKSLKTYYTLKKA